MMMASESTPELAANTTTRITNNLTFCTMLNLPSGHLECINVTSSSTPTTNPVSQNLSTTEHCIYCGSGATFSTGEGLDDYYSRGHLTIFAIHVVTASVGILGAFGTALIIAVLRRRSKGGSDNGSSFGILLAALAWMDLAVCSAYPVRAISLTVWFQNWNRGFVPLFANYVALNFTGAAKAGSTLITVVLTIERYVAIAFPFAAKRLFTPFKTQVLVGLVTLLACVSGAPRFGSSVVARNVVHPGIKSVRGLAYLMYPTTSFKCLDCLCNVIEAVVSIPTLLLFNGLIFYKIRQISARRKELSSSQQKDLNAGKMILPIVAVLLVCSTLPLFSIFFILGKGTTEMVMIMNSIFALNSAVNFPIYYWTSGAFQAEAKVVLAHWFSCGCSGKRSGNGEADDSPTPKTSTTDIENIEMVN